MYEVLFLVEAQLCTKMLSKNFKRIAKALKTIYFFQVSQIHLNITLQSILAKMDGMYELSFLNRNFALKCFQNFFFKIADSSKTI